MKDIYSAWPIIVAALEGSNEAEPLESYPCLDSLLCMYINSVSNVLGLEHAFTGKVGNDGVVDISQSDNVEPFFILACATNFVSDHCERNINGELDFTALLDEWRENLKTIPNGEKLDINIDSSFVNTLILQSSFSINVDIGPSTEDISRMVP